MIIAKDLEIEAGGRTLVEGVDFALYPGDKVGLVGRNGAGKTTLLRTLAGLRAPAAGTVAAQGVIGYLSQEAALPELEHPQASALERDLTRAQAVAPLAFDQRLIKYGKRGASAVTIIGSTEQLLLTGGIAIADGRFLSAADAEGGRRRE